MSQDTDSPIYIVLGKQNLQVYEDLHHGVVKSKLSAGSPQLTFGNTLN